MCGSRVQAEFSSIKMSECSKTIRYHIYQYWKAEKWQACLRAQLNFSSYCVDLAINNTLRHVRTRRRRYGKILRRRRLIVRHVAHLARVPHLSASPEFSRSRPAPAHPQRSEAPRLRLSAWLMLFSLSSGSSGGDGQVLGRIS